MSTWSSGTEVVDFMREHPDDFAPYMEDEEDFDSYCSRMCKVRFTCTLSDGIVLAMLTERATSKRIRWEYVSPVE